MPTIRDRLHDIYTDLEMSERRKAEIHRILHDLRGVIDDISQSDESQAVIRTRNGAVDDVVIDCDQVHLEQMDDGVWSLILYRGDERVAFMIAPAIHRRDGFSQPWNDVGLIEDTVGCEFENTKDENAGKPQFQYGDPKEWRTNRRKLVIEREEQG